MCSEKGTKRLRTAGASTLSVTSTESVVMSENRVTKQSKDSKIVTALGNHYKSSVTMTLVGVDYRIPALQKVFTDHIAVTAKAEQAHLDLNAAVAAQAASEIGMRPIRRALSNTVAAKFGESSSTLAEFGFKPKKEPKVPVATKAEAVAKATATKAAGGKKAKKKAAAAESDGATTDQSSASQQTAATQSAATTGAGTTPPKGTTGT
jgi:hypothetical protein